jgi:hypothetical protein
MNHGPLASPTAAAQSDVDSQAGSGMDMDNLGESVHSPPSADAKDGSNRTASKVQYNLTDDGKNYDQLNSSSPAHRWE